MLVFQRRHLYDASALQRFRQAIKGDWRAGAIDANSIKTLKELAING